MRSMVPGLAATLLALGASLSLCAEDVSRIYSASMEVTHGKPYVMVSINGRGPFRFIVDTGTGGDAIITSELATQLGLPVIGTAHLNDPTGRGGQAAPVRRIDSLSIGGVEFASIKAIEHALPSGDGSTQGMLGLTLFRDVLLTLDYPNGRLLMSDGALQPDGERSVHLFRMPDGVPIARLNIGKVEVDAQLDSGGAGLSLPERLVLQLRMSESPSLFAKGQSLSTRFEIKVARLADDVRLGDITLEQPWVEINSAFPMANFGSCPMQHFSFTFDQRNLLVRIEGPRKRINLGVTPAPLRLANQPSEKQVDNALVPVG